MSGFPLRYVHQNMLVGHGDARAALFRVETVSYPFMAARGQARVAAAAGAVGVRGGGRLLAVAGAPRLSGASATSSRRTALLDARRQSAEAWRAYLQGHEAHLRELRSFAPEVYLAVSLRGRASALGAGVLRACDRARRRVEELFGVGRGGADRRARSSRRWSPRRSACSGARRACLPARRATTREVQWLLRRAACRGVGEPELDEHWRPEALMVETTDGRPAYEPLETDLVRHANAPILEEDRTLVVDAPEGRWLSGDARGRRAAGGGEFPGGAELLFWPLEAVGFPVDACCTRAGSPTATRSRGCAGGSLDADVAYSEQMTSAHGPLSYTSRRTASSRASSTPTCSRTSARRC